MTYLIFKNYSTYLTAYLKVSKSRSIPTIKKILKEVGASPNIRFVITHSEGEARYYFEHKFWLKEENNYPHEVAQIVNSFTTNLLSISISLHLNATTIIIGEYSGHALTRYLIRPL